MLSQYKHLYTYFRVSVCPCKFFCEKWWSRWMSQLFICVMSNILICGDLSRNIRACASVHICYLNINIRTHTSVCLFVHARSSVSSGDPGGCPNCLSVLCPTYSYAVTLAKAQGQLMSTSGVILWIPSILAPDIRSVATCNGLVNKSGNISPLMYYFSEKSLLSWRFLMTCSISTCPPFFSQFHMSEPKSCKSIKSTSFLSF